MAEETLLISKGRILSLLKKLEDKPNNYSICTECEIVYNMNYEACDCRRFD